ncbi:MAG: hypothetical protein IID41_04845, partial [Planctomycetes bacterium]|nr:hypothetical protein [Planctomycetota bacterium]
MTEAFTLERIGKTSAKFDRVKLLSFNTDWSAKLPPDRLLAAFRDFLQLRIADCGLRIEEPPSRGLQSARTTEVGGDADSVNSRSRRLQPARSPEVASSTDDRAVAQAEACGSLSNTSIPPGLLTADDATLARVLEVCKGFRTFADVLTKAGFIFADDDAIEYDPKAVKKVLEKNDGEGYAMLERILPVLEELPDWTAE